MGAFERVWEESIEYVVEHPAGRRAPYPGLLGPDVRWNETGTDRRTMRPADLHHARPARRRSRVADEDEDDYDEVVIVRADEEDEYREVVLVFADRDLSDEPEPPKRPGGMTPAGPAGPGGPRVPPDEEPPDEEVVVRRQKDPCLPWRVHKPEGNPFPGTRLVDPVSWAAFWAFRGRKPPRLHATGRVHPNGSDLYALWCQGQWHYVYYEPNPLDGADHWQIFHHDENCVPRNTTLWQQLRCTAH